jgi:hypothetical protein
MLLMTFVLLHICQDISAFTDGTPSATRLATLLVFFLLDYCKSQSFIVPRLELQYLIPRFDQMVPLLEGLDAVLQALANAGLVRHFTLRASSGPATVPPSENLLRLLAHPVLETLHDIGFRPSVPTALVPASTPGQPPVLCLEIHLNKVRQYYVISHKPDAGDGAYCDVIRVRGLADGKTYAIKVQDIFSRVGSNMWHQIIRGECRAFNLPEKAAVVPAAIHYSRGMIYVRYCLH